MPKLQRYRARARFLPPIEDAGWFSDCILRARSVLLEGRPAVMLSYIVPEEGQALDQLIGDRRRLEVVLLDMRGEEKKRITVDFESWVSLPLDVDLLDPELMTPRIALLNVRYS